MQRFSLVLALFTVLIALPASLFGQVRPALAGSTWFYVTSDITGTEGTQTDWQVMAVTTVAPTSYTIDWGDGTPPTTYGNYDSSNPDNGAYDCVFISDQNWCTVCYHCNLRGSHTYWSSGTYSVKIEYWTGCCVSHSTNVTATIADAGLFVFDGASPASLTQTEGGTFNDKVAAFTDPALTVGGGGYSESNYSATIDWGDGSAKSTGTLSNGGGDPSCTDFCRSFSIGVNGSHQYTGAVGTTYTVKATLTDLATGGTSATNSITLTILDADLHGTAATVAPIALHPFSGTVAGFTDDAPNSNPAEYSATIDWGDSTGTDTNAAIVANANGGFDVNGTHTYAAPGSYPVNVTINDKGGSTTTAASTANAGTPVPQLTSLSPETVEAGGNAFTLKVYGSDFLPTSQVQWNGSNLVTTYVSSTELDALVPDGNFVRPKTAQVTVVTSGGGTSSLLPFFVINSTASVTCMGTATGTSSSAGASASTSSCDSTSPISLTGSGGTGTVAVAHYSGNPGGTPSFYSQNGGAYLDVYVAPGNTFASVTITDCALGGGSVVYWWNGTAWVQASNQKYDPATQCVTITVTSSTVPTITQLNQTPITAANQPPVLTVPGNKTVEYGDSLATPLSISATNPEPGDHLTLGGTGLPQGLTLVDNGNGTGVVQGAPTSAPGDYLVTFSVSDSVNPAVTGSLTITVKPDETSVTIPTSQQFLAQGHSTVLSAVLTDDASAPIKGRTVTLTLGNGTLPDASCSGMTDATGTVTCSVDTVARRLGPQTITASFAGDTDYRSSHSSRGTLLFAYLPGGSFVIGDRSTGAGTVTYWGAGWSKANTLSGGAAPDSFKGFATTGQVQPTCGKTWTSSPGLSVDPMAILTQYTPGHTPGYIATIVSSSITKSGSLISGNIQQVVIVKTGYPFRIGTGAIVAVLCHA